MSLMITKLKPLGKFPFDPANIQWVKETKATQKATKRSASSAAIKDLESNLSFGLQELSQAMVQSNLEITDSISQMIQAMQQSNAQVLEAIKTQQQSPTLNWTPLIQAVATAIPAVVGVPVSLATPNPVTPASPTTSTTPAAPVSEIKAQLESLTSTVNTLALTQREQSKTLESLSQGFNNLTNTVAQLSQ